MDKTENKRNAAIKALDAADETDALTLPTFGDASERARALVKESLQQMKEARERLAETSGAVDENDETKMTVEQVCFDDFYYFFYYL